MGTVGVVGGGVAGLAAAHYLLRKPSVTRCVDCLFGSGVNKKPFVCPIQDRHFQNPDRL